MGFEAENEYYRKALDSLGRRLFVVSPDLEILAANLQATKEGLPDIIGKKCHRYFHGEQTPCYSCPVPEVLASGRLVARSMMDLASGQAQGQCLQATPIFEGDKIKAVTVLDSLDKTQVQRLQTEKMASIGKLAAGVANQLNNPLGGIILHAQLMMEEYLLEDAAKEDLKRIVDDAERCRNTVRELLEFARQTQQEIRLNDLNQAISQTLFLLENQTLFHHIEIVKSFEPELPKVPSDIQQLNLVFMNMILNAAEAMEGTGQLRVETLTADTGYGVLIRISDTGPGIPKEILPLVFEPFFTTKEEGRGTGLGLSLAHGIVEDHKGRIWAESEPGEGTIFTIELPLGQPSEQE